MRVISNQTECKICQIQEDRKLHKLEVLEMNYEGLKKITFETEKAQKQVEMPRAVEQQAEVGKTAELEQSMLKKEESGQTWQRVLNKMAENIRESNETKKSYEAVITRDQQLKKDAKKRIWGKTLRDLDKPKKQSLEDFLKQR